MGARAFPRFSVRLWPDVIVLSRMPVEPFIIWETDRECNAANRSLPLNAKYFSLERAHCRKNSARRRWKDGKGCT
jgi:hypothetical protein